MNKYFYYLTFIITVKLLLAVSNMALSFTMMTILILIYTLKNYTFMSLLLLLEFMTLTTLISFFSTTQLLFMDSWLVFFILVLSAMEASIGISLLVCISRLWGESMKMKSFV